jgi:outer membrane protein TolC
MNHIFTRAACCLALLTVFNTVPVSARPTMPGEKVIIRNAGVTVLSLNEAISLGLSNNSEIRIAYLERGAQKAALRAVETRFSPRFALNGSHVASQNQNDSSSLTEISPTATLQSEYGTQFSLSWNNRIVQDERGAASRDEGASFTVVQPLMRGAARDIVTAPLRLAHLNEQINRLNLKASVSNVVTQIVLAYNELLCAQEQLRLAQEGMSRARRALTDDLYRAAAGYWVETGFDDFIHIEAETADRELALEEVNNRLDASRQKLLRLLALNVDTKIHAADALDAQPFKIDLARTIHAAREQQPDYRIQRLAANQAAIELAVARDQRQWDVSLIGGARQTRSRSLSAMGGYQSIQSRDGHAGIQINIPIGDAAPHQSEVRARIKLMSQESRLADAQQLLERDIRGAARELDAQWRRYEIAQRSLELSRRKLEVERTRTRTTPPDNFRALALDASLVDAEAARINALIAHRNAKAALDKVSGATLETWDIDLND